jgi:hypothetical protein
MGSPGHPESSPGGRVQLAGLTPRDLLERIVTACAQSPVVTAYAVRTLDLDILSLRVYLVDGFFHHSHHLCDPISFETFLTEVETLRFPSAQP